ncbi:hypothetical protein M0R45_003079 [Rubus argutus]|uniref:Uncharacterized protein n=1 Tax=Rubus argutus TaxID=59490 RepID=A0AAW1YFU8_RUBAR
MELYWSSNIEAFIKCKAEPESVDVRPSNLIVASLFYWRWDETVVWLWASRLDRVHNLLPKLNPKVSVPPHHLVKLEERLFSEGIKRLIDGESARFFELKNSINGHGTVLELETCLKHEPSWRWDANAHVFVDLPFRASRKMDKIASVRILFRGTTNGNLG